MGGPARKNMNFFDKGNWVLAGLAAKFHGKSRYNFLGVDQKSLQMK